MNVRIPRVAACERALALAAAVFMALPAGAQPAGAMPSPQSGAELKPSSEVKIAGTDVAVPSRRKYVAPEYPADAAAQGIRGIVIVEVLIGEDGKVESARVTRSIPGLDEAALTAVRMWEYEPTKVGGKPVKVQLSQSMTFALRLPELQRALGVPELKSGGNPPLPAGLSKPESAAIAVKLGAQGEVAEAALVEGEPAAADALMRAVRSWRFNLAEGATPPSFTIRAEWTPGPPPAVVLRALDPKTVSLQTAAAPSSTTPPAANVQKETAAPAMPSPTAAAPPAPVEDVLPAAIEPAAKEQGASSISDVILGDNIPELARGRRPVWPPLARLGNVTGDVTVRFSIDLAGKVTVHSAEGPDLLKPAAEQAVSTWLFRRTAIDRVNLIATFKYTADRTMAKVERVP